ncbi:hypothetical protein ES703_57412 [subsurface metagenome]
MVCSVEPAVISMLESAFAGAEKLKVDRVTITESVSMIMVIYNTWEFLHTATGL